MKILSCLLALSLVALPLAAYAEERGTREEAVALCEQVKADYAANGAEATFKEITEGQKYKSKDLYPFVYSMEGVVLAHGQKPGMVGMNRFDARDTMQGGKLYIQEMITLLKSGNPGWVQYVFLDPLTKKAMDKESYVLLLDDKTFVGVGIYK